MADKCEAFAMELENDGRSPNGADPAKAPVARNGQTFPQMGEFSNLTQSAAILKALERGPQTTRQLFDLLNHNGQSFREVSYITALLGRLKDKVERVPNDREKIRLKEPLHK
jgi:hypothetical protein